MKKCLECGTNNRKNINGKRVTTEFVGAYCIDCFSKPKIEPLDEELADEQINKLKEEDRQRNILKNREIRLNKKDYWQKVDL